MSASSPGMTHLVFVYGTLKQGFANFHVNAGLRVEGEFETVESFPLYVVGPYCIPWLVDRAGEGQRVAGQLFEVDADGLARMDMLERLGEPGWYTRRGIAVRARHGAAGPLHEALVYFGAAELPDAEIVHAAGLAEFLPSHDGLYRRRRG